MAHLGGRHVIPVTLKQIAEKTGYSIPTVQQVLNNYPVRVSAATRARILEAAREMNYRPNVAARGLQARKTFLLGMLFNNVNFPLMVEFTRGFQSASLSRGFAPLLLTHSSLDEEQQNLLALLDRRVDAIVANASVDFDGTTNSLAFSKVRQQPLPLVEFQGQFIDGAPRVTIDFFSGAYQATRRVIAAGHKRIALFIHSDYRASETVPGLYWTAALYWHGYQKAMAEAGLTELIVTYPVERDRTRRSSHAHGAQERSGALLDHPDHPTAAVCYRDDVAEALMRSCLRGRAKSKKLFSIASFGDMLPFVNEAAELLCIRAPIESAASAAAAMAIQLIEGKPVTDLAIGPDAAPG